MNDQNRAYALLTGAACLGSALVLAMAAGPAPLLGLFGAGLAGAAGGILGNASDRALCRAARSLSERVLDTSRPLNHDLARAVRGAQLQALQTLLAEHQQSEVQALQESGWGRSADVHQARWTQLAVRLNAWCDAEKSAPLPVLDVHTQKMLSVRVDSLLNEPQQADTAPRVEALWAAALDALLLEVQAVTGPLPEAFIGRLRQADDGWRALTRLQFAERYKDNRKVFAVLVVELLSDFRVQLDALGQDQAALKTIVEEKYEAIAVELQQQCGTLATRFIEVMHELRARLDELPKDSELQVRVGHVQEVLDELQQGQDQTSMQLRRQERLLRMLLMQLIREEAKQRGQVIDGRFGIAAEDVNTIIRERSRLLVGRASALAELDRWQAEQASGVRFVGAAAGLGKTSLLATWTLAREMAGDRVVRHFFSRNYPETIDSVSALEHLLRQMRSQLGQRAELATDDAKAPKDKIHRLLALPVTEKPLIVVLDGLDEAEAHTLPAFLPGQLGQGVYVVIGVRQQDPAHPPAILRDWCQRSGKEWIRLPNSGEEWTRSQLLPLNEEALDDWLAIALAVLSQPARSELIKPLLRASEGIPLFTRFLIDDLSKQQAQSLNLQVAPSFRAYAERELRPFADIGQPVHPVFALLTLTRAPLKQSEMRRILGQPIALVPALMRWFLVSGERQDPQYAFVHPRLAQVFAEVIPLDDRDAAQDLLLRHAIHWSVPGNDYALRHGLVHLVAAKRSAEAITLVRSIRFHQLRLERFADWDGLSESLALAQQLPLSGDDQDWLAGLAAMQPTLHRLAPQDRPQVLAGMAADWLGEPPTPGQRLVLAHPEPPRRSPLRSVFLGHRGRVNGALELKDGQVLSWSDDGSLRRWDPAAGASVEWRGHTEPVWGALELKDGQVLSWSIDGSLRCWDPAKGASVTWCGHTRSVSGALELKDGHVLSWSEDGSLHRWGPSTGASVVWRGHTGWVGGALELMDGQVLSWSDDGSLRCWDPANGASVAWCGHTRSVSGALELKNGHVLSWSDDGSLRRWDPSTRASVEWRGHAWAVEGALELKNGQVISWSADGSLRRWVPATGTSVAWYGHTGWVSGALELEDGHVLSWSRDGSLRRWDPATEASVEWRGHAWAVDGALELKDGQVLSWSRDGSLRRWDPATGKSVKCPGHTDAIWGALELKDGQVLSWSDDGSLYLWDLATGESVEHPGHTDAICGALELKDGHVLSLSVDGSLRRWDPSTGASVEWPGHADAVESTLELKDGYTLIRSEDGSLYRWDPATGGPEEWRGHVGSVWWPGSLKLKDGQVLSWIEDGSLRCWDLTTGESTAIWASPHGHVRGVIELEGLLLAVASGTQIMFVRRYPLHHSVPS